MTDAAPPILHILAGPNGAGKSTLYDVVISRYTTAEFVNPDRLVFAAIGAHATTMEQAALGQRLADRRRAELMAARVSLVTESTFSHVSKLDLVRSALNLSYEVLVYHISLDSAELAVARVASRLTHGGHPVPEKRIRDRYERNGAIIRQAVRLATRGFVFDNSIIGQPPRRLMTFEAGLPGLVASNLPTWAKDLYGADIDGASDAPQD